MQIGNPPRQRERDQSREGWNQEKEHRDEPIIGASNVERDLIEHTAKLGGNDRACDHQDDRKDLTKIQFGTPI